MKKLLVLTSTFPRWKNDDTPGFVYELSKKLSNNFDVSVLAPHYPNAKTSENLGKIKVSRFRYFPEKYETVIPIPVRRYTQESHTLYCCICIFDPVQKQILADA